MEHIKRNFNLETWIRPSEWTKGGGGGGRGQNVVFLQNMVKLHIMLKGVTNTVTCKQIVYP